MFAKYTEFLYHLSQLLFVVVGILLYLSRLFDTFQAVVFEAALNSYIT